MGNEEPHTTLPFARAELIGLQTTLSAGRAAPDSLVGQGGLALWYEYAATPTGAAENPDALMVIAHADDPTLASFVGDERGELRDGYVWRRRSA